MSTHSVRQVETRERVDARAWVVSALGPATIAIGVAWALIQPWRLTLLHPHGQGFWWLVIEPPLFVVAAGIAFHQFVARPLLDDLRTRD
jgi:hypothetical protein